METRSLAQLSGNLTLQSTAHYFVRPCQLLLSRVFRELCDVGAKPLSRLASKSAATLKDEGHKPVTWVPCVLLSLAPSCRLSVAPGCGSELGGASCSGVSDRNVKPNPAIFRLVFQVKDSPFDWISAWLAASRLSVPSWHSLLKKRLSRGPPGDKAANSFAGPPVPPDNATSGLAGAAVVAVFVKLFSARNSCSCLELTSGACSRELCL